MNEKITETTKVKKSKAGPKTPEKREQMKSLYLEKLIECGGVSLAARKALGLDHHTIDNWREKDAEFDKAIEEVDAIAVGEASSMLWKSMQEGNATSIIFYLKTRGSKYGFREQQTIDLKTDIPKGFSKEQAKEFIAKMNK